VRCRTCYNDHDYRFEQAPPPKIDPRKLALMAEKAANAAAIAQAGSPEPADAADAAEPEIAVVTEELAPKSKAKARGRR
jgi:hypothetical protein